MKPPKYYTIVFKVDDWNEVDKKGNTFLWESYQGMKVSAVSIGNVMDAWHEAQKLLPDEGKEIRNKHIFNE